VINNRIQPPSQHRSHQAGRLVHRKGNLDVASLHALLRYDPVIQVHCLNIESYIGSDKIVLMLGNAFILYNLSLILTSVELTSSLQQTLINATQQMLSWFSSYISLRCLANSDVKYCSSGSGVGIFLCLIDIATGSAMFAKDSLNRAAGGAMIAFLYLFSPTRAYNFGINGNLSLYIAENSPILSSHARLGFLSTILNLLYPHLYLCVSYWTSEYDVEVLSHFHSIGCHRVHRRFTSFIPKLRDTHSKRSCSFLM
jgi:hypothetical protein